MSLSGRSVEFLETALLDAFPDDDALDLLIKRVAMQTRVSSRAPLASRVSKLVEAVDAAGRVRDLLDAAFDLAPGNVLLAQSRSSIAAELAAPPLHDSGLATEQTRARRRRKLALGVLAGFIVAGVAIGVTAALVVDGKQPTAKPIGKPRLISCTSDPPGAAIIVDGVQTPFRTPHDVELPATMAAGHAVRVQLRKSGFEDTDRVIDPARFVVEGNRMTFSLDEQLWPKPR